MKTIIAGSRGITDYGFVLRAYEDCEWTVTEIVSGGAGGVDKLGEKIASEYNVPLKVFPYPSEFGRRGGPIRNEQMAKYADALIAVWDGKSRGTKNMIQEAEKHKLRIRIYLY